MRTLHAVVVLAVICLFSAPTWAQEEDEGPADEPPAAAEEDEPPAGGDDDPPTPDDDGDGDKPGGADGDGDDDPAQPAAAGDDGDGDGDGDGGGDGDKPGGDGDGDGDDDPAQPAAAGDDDPPGPGDDGDDDPAQPAAAGDDDPPGEADDDDAPAAEDGQYLDDDDNDIAEGVEPTEFDLDGDGVPEKFDVYEGDFADPFGDEPAVNSPEYLEEYGEPYVEFDLDGDGVADEEFAAEWKAEFAAAEAEGMAGDLEAGEAMLDARDEAAELDPAQFMNIETFRKLVKLAKKKVLEKTKKKIAKKTGQRMTKIAIGIFAISLLGFGLLLTPLFLAKKYPGKGGLLFKYSALAAVTFFLAVNLFGAVMMLMRGAQAVVGESTNPQIAIVGGTFDALDDNADEFIPMGKELFGPALEQMQGATDEQPLNVLMANAQKLIEDTQVFIKVAKAFKRLDFLLGQIPTILLLVTLLLFVKAVAPTMKEIIKMPATAATAGAGGGDVFKTAIGRVFAEAKATVCAIGILLVLSTIAGFVLHQIVQPALESLLSYFVLAIIYLQFVDGASSALVFFMLFAVLFFLILNLAVVILSMSFFLGKSQKVFQQRFGYGIALSEHRTFWKWGPIGVLWSLAFPLIFVHVARFGVSKINEKVMAGQVDADAINWKAAMLAGPLFLVVGFILLFWASQALRGLKFLATYKVKVPPDPKK